MRGVAGLHGQSHMLVLRHADVEAAAQAVVQETIFRNKLVSPAVIVTKETNLQCCYSSEYFETKIRSKFHPRIWK